MTHDLLALDVVLLDHDLQREDRVAAGGVLVAQRRCCLSLCAGEVSRASEGVEVEEMSQDLGME